MAERGQGDDETGEAKGPEGEGTMSNIEKMENGNAQPDSPVKKEEKTGMFKTFKQSIKKVGERSPLASNIRGLKEKRGPDFGKEGNIPETGISAPASPSQSIGSPKYSPLKGKGGFFKKDGENTDVSPHVLKDQPGHSRSQSDSSGIMGDILMKPGAALRRSLRLVGKKDKVTKQGPPQLVCKTLSETEELKQVEVEVEVEETYTLPEIPIIPLSVMQINKLIEMEVLEEAHLNLLSLREELKRERVGGDEGLSSLELANKEKDLKLLYSALQEKVKEIVRDSNKLPSRNKQLLVHVARIIQEEEKREVDPDSLFNGWRDIWKAAVQEGVQAKIESIHLDSREQNSAWLAVHLGLLGQAIVEDLENVKNELQGSYPRSFEVFTTYIGSYHHAIGQHIKKILQQKLDSKDCYSLLEWIINRFGSEKIMGSPTLQPDMREEDRTLSLESGLLDKIKKTYCDCVKDDLRTSLGNVVRLQSEMWTERTEPERNEEFYYSEMHMDIMTVVKSYIQNSLKIDSDLEKRIVCSCSEELKEFPQRFEREFRQCDTMADSSLQAEYQVTYINSFTILREQMEVYRECSPPQVEAVGREMEAVVDRLGQSLLEEFKTAVRPFLRRMMTRKWLSTDEDFKQIVKRTDNLSQLCRGMKPPYVQGFVNEVHYHMVKEYISQLMKNNYSCKNRKHEKAATKMREQWAELQDVFEDLKSTSHWLQPVGEHMCNIIGQKNKREIKENLAGLVKDYPDISKKHLSAVLYFRGMVRGRERQLILRRLTELKRSVGDSGDKSQALFSDIQVTINTDCLANVPLLCLPLFSADS